MDLSFGKPCTPKRSKSTATTRALTACLRVYILHRPDSPATLERLQALSGAVHAPFSCLKHIRAAHVDASDQFRCEMLILCGPGHSGFKHEHAVHSASIHCPFSVHSDRKSSIQPETALNIVMFSGCFWRPSVPELPLI